MAENKLNLLSNNEHPQFDIQQQPVFLTPFQRQKP